MGSEFFRRWRPGSREAGDSLSEFDRNFERTRLDIASALFFGMESRDSVLHVTEHCAQVAFLAEMIASELTIAHDLLQGLLRAARLHEIGMIGVPMDLVRRAGTLAPAELARVRAQASFSAEVARATQPGWIADLIEHQYSDYVDLLASSLPDGERVLAGILRVADVIAAVTSPRPYQKPLTPSAREELLKRGEASKFHPMAVRAALAAPLPKPEG